MVENNNWMQRHGAKRDRMLAAATDLLKGDERFVAAWLSGSFGRGDADGLSDIDLSVVVAGPYADVLCHRQHQVGAGTTPERLTLLREVGEPAIVHENHFNAPSGGSFTTCVYAGGVVIDWVFIPAAMAMRPATTRLLFDTVDVDVQVADFTLSDDERHHKLSEHSAFFWMMAVPTTKALLRGDLVQFHHCLDMMCRNADEVERLLARQPSRYARGSRAPFVTTAAEQRDAVVAICQRMDALAPAVIDSGATVPESRLEAVAPWVRALHPEDRSG